MIYVGIDVAKDNHDCFITNSDGEVLADPFTISNNRDGFNSLYQRINSFSKDLNKVKVGLEATEHYNRFSRSDIHLIMLYWKAYLNT